MKDSVAKAAVGQRSRGSGGRRSASVRMAEIEAAARQELSEKGYQSFQPAEVARRCGVSEATVYRYFPTRRDLLIKVAEDWTEEVLSIEPEIARQTDIFSRLRHIIRHSLWVIRSEPVLSRFVLQEVRPDPSYRSMRLFKLNRRFTSNVISLVEEGIVSGHFRPGVSPVVVRNLIYGGIEHQTWSYLRGEGDFDLDQAADDIAGILFHGLSATPLSDAEQLAPMVSKLQSRADALRDEIGRLSMMLPGTGQCAGT